MKSLFLVCYVLIVSAALCALAHVEHHRSRLAWVDGGRW